MKTEKERTLEKEIIRLEYKVELLERKLMVAEDFNRKYFREVEDLSYYIKQMEGTHVQIEKMPILWGNGSN